MPSHISEARIICPHCSTFDSRSERYDVDGHMEPTDDFDVKCANCKKTFHVERHIQITFITRKKKAKKPDYSEIGSGRLCFHHSR